MITRLADRLLRAALPRDKASETIRHDLAEELRQRQRDPRNKANGLWFLWEALKLAGHFTLLRLDGMRTGMPRGWFRHSQAEHEEGGGAVTLESWIQDIRFALRTFARRPLFAVFAVVTLALGIGGSTAMFSVVDVVLLRPLPYFQPERIVSVRQIMERWKDIANLRESWDRAWLHPDQFAALRDRVTTFSAIAVHNKMERVLRGSGRPEVITVGRASTELLSVLGVQPVQGRWFTREEEGDENGPLHVVALSDEFRRAHFSEGQKVLGTSLQIDNDTYEVIGVLPPGFRLREFAWGQIEDGHRDVWIPGGHICCFQWEAIGRLAPGATVDQAEAELQGLLPGSDPGERRFTVIPRRQAEAERLARPLIFLFGATGILLLIACGNVATLLLGELSGREHELAARAALGAGRARITRQLLTECLVLGAVGALGGLGLAQMLTPALAGLGPTLPGMDEIGLDGRVLAAGVVMGTSAVLIFGLLPALTATSGPLVDRLRAAGRSSAARSRLSSGVVALELALTTVLLVCGGLLTRSFDELMATDPGFDAAHLAALTIRPEIPATEQGMAQVMRESDEIRSALAAVPGVTSVTVSSDLPFISKPTSTTTFLADGTRAASSLFWRVRPSYHETLGIPLLSGRFLTEADEAAKAPVAVISESLARANWPGRSPLGEVFTYHQGPITVVGVVADVKHETLAYRTEPVFYMPLADELVPDAFAVRTAGAPETVMPDLREAVLGIAPDALIDVLTPYDDLLTHSASVERFRMVLTLGFALVATLLAGIGVMGVTGRAVAGQRRELAIRMALGARAQSLLAGLLRRHLRVAGLGLALGLLLAAWCGRLIASLLFGVDPGDPVTFASVAVGVLILALSATYFPARRIVSLEPANVLRPE